MLPAVYMPILLAFSLATYFCEITNFWYLQLLIESLNGAVAVSIHDYVIEIIYWYNPSGETMVMVSNQRLRESSNRNIRKGKGGQGEKLTILPLACVFLLKSETLTSWNTQVLWRHLQELLHLSTLFNDYHVVSMYSCVSWLLANAFIQVDAKRKF